MRTACLSVFVLLAAALLVDFSLARSSGDRSGSRSGSSSGSSRSSGSKAKSYSSYDAAIAASVTVSGMTRYRARHHNSKHYDSSPTVCYTTNAGILDDGTLTSHFGYFVCPYEISDADSDTYCCGPSDQQTCCEFWEDTGRAAGTIIGIILGVILIVIITCCVVICCKRKRERAEKVSSTSPDTEDNPDNPPPYTEPASYSLNPVSVPAIPENPDPPTLSSNQALPKVINTLDIRIQSHMSTESPQPCIVSCHIHF